ncbi:MAG: hypothetical protein ACM3MK_11200 [Chitinophagales bacterium]
MATNEQFINDLIKKTTENKIQWTILQKASRNIIYAELENLLKSFDDYVEQKSSYALSHKQGIIIFLTLINANEQKWFSLIIKKDVRTDYIILNTKKENQVELFRLANIITRQSSGIDEFMEDFMNS